jgi:hypothetical protein
MNKISLLVILFGITSNVEANMSISITPQMTAQIYDSKNHDMRRQDYSLDLSDKALTKNCFIPNFLPDPKSPQYPEAKLNYSLPQDYFFGSYQVSYEVRITKMSETFYAIRTKIESSSGPIVRAAQGLISDANTTHKAEKLVIQFGTPFSVEFKLAREDSEHNYDSAFVTPALVLKVCQ